MAAPEFAAQNLFAETAEVLRDARLAPLRIRFSAAIVIGETVADLLTGVIGFFVSYLLYISLSDTLRTQHSSIQILSIGLCFAILFTFLRGRDGAYRRDTGILQIRETERNIRVALQSLTLTQIFELLLRLDVSAFVTLIAAILVPIMLIIQKSAFFRAVAWLRERYQSNLRVLIYGADDTGRIIASALLYSPRLALTPIAVLEDRRGQHGAVLPVMGYRGRSSIPILTNVMTPEFLRSFHADLLLIAGARFSSERIAATKDAAKIAGLKVGVLTSVPVEKQRYTQAFEIDGVTFAIPSDRIESAFYGPAKRLFDVALSAALLVAWSPVLIAIALLIRIDSPGPALFVQKRVGKDGTIFRMYKFRTMYASTPPDELSPTTSKDWRITQIGHSLRSSGLDELPQLFNVLLGTMSLVGPRPEMPFVVQHYSAEESHRLEVIPGITGLWQLSADRAFPIHQNVQYDLYYIRNRNLSMDFAILIHTLAFALRGGI
jgi:exopolysaccharide biosynthesis polyprenyl glycosylphosphotransferase